MLESKSEAPQQPKDNEWECERCSAMNSWNASDLDSYKCKSCRTPNEIIQEMINLQQNSEFQNNELELIDNYNKQKNQDPYKSRPSPYTVDQPV